MPAGLYISSLVCGQDWVTVASLRASGGLTSQSGVVCSLCYLVIIKKCTFSYEILFFFSGRFRDK